MAIRANGHLLSPTKFPDGTSQVWKLPSVLGESTTVAIDWRFEEERELIDLASLCLLFPAAKKILSVPYLPYARQDKAISNDSTFALKVFLRFLPMMDLHKVICFDVHNFDAVRVPCQFENVTPYAFHSEAIGHFRPDVIVFPDAGAHARYHYLPVEPIIGLKQRDPASGQITDFKLFGEAVGQRFLIIDDICDGGATFIIVANALRAKYGNQITIGLAVSHGIFSKGKEVLREAGISEIYTTNSLPRNKDGFPV